jgi:hypothetical protein
VAESDASSGKGFCASRRKQVTSKRTQSKEEGNVWPVEGSVKPLDRIPSYRQKTIHYHLLTSFILSLWPQLACSSAVALDNGVGDEGTEGIANSGAEGIRRHHWHVQSLVIGQPCRPQPRRRAGAVAFFRADHSRSLILQPNNTSCLSSSGYPSA